MKSRLLYLVRYYLLWVVFFAIQKPLFMLAQHRLMGQVEWTDYVAVIWHGLPLDFSVAAYISIVMGVWLCASFWMSKQVWQKVADTFTVLCLGVALLVFFADNGCFPSWGYHLDKTLFVFLRSPRAVWACAESYVWLLGGAVYVGGWVMCAGVGYWAFVIGHGDDRTWRLTATWQRKALYTALMFIVSALLFLPIRGSFSVSTMNTGRVYFSDNQMLNTAAINPLFNIAESIGENAFDVKKYTYMPSEEAASCVREMFPSSSSEETKQQWFTTSRPNIVLVILESFSHNAWSAMPHLQQLAEEGIYFSNAYAASYRTDRGVVAILSGFPGQPTSSLMTVPYKSQSLPGLGKSLRAAGYQTAFYYGGDEDFTCMRSYLISQGFDDRISDHDFPIQDRRSKWGVPDHVLFHRAGKDIVQKSEKALAERTGPRLDVVLTLSSHEPFEVDYHHLPNPYLNSVAYTDSCIGAFVSTLRRSAVWDSTVLVFVADHGYPYPETLQRHELARYHIPVVIAGGAVKEPVRVAQPCGQIDLVPTLLSQLALPAEQYTFGKDMSNTETEPFAFFAYNDGFGLITPQDTVVVDAKANCLLTGTEGETNRRARAFVQRVMETIEKL